jgi:hypothetical protein
MSLPSSSHLLVPNATARLLPLFLLAGAESNAYPVSTSKVRTLTASVTSQPLADSSLGMEIELIRGACTVEISRLSQRHFQLRMGAEYLRAGVVVVVQGNMRNAGA